MFRAATGKAGGFILSVRTELVAQGAYRVHQILLMPYFEQYEETIDEKVTHVTRESKRIIHRTLKAVLYALFVDSQEVCFFHSLS